MSMAVILTYISIAITSLLYFSGWMYIFYYMRDFGFSVFEADIPFHYFLIYSFAVLGNILNNLLSILIMITVSSGLFILLHLFVVLQVEQRSLALSLHIPSAYTTPLLVFGLLSVTVFGFVETQGIAKNAAEAQAARIRDSEISYIVQLREEATKRISEYEVSLGNRTLKAFFDQTQKDWRSLSVNVIFSDQNRHFLMLRQSGTQLMTTVSIERSDVMFLGLHTSLGGR